MDTTKKLQRIILLVLLAINLLLVSITHAKTEEWYGTYTYEASLGENAAEDQMIIQYSFTLTKDKCLVTSQGYQTDEQIICTTESSGKNLLVKFKSFENGSTENIYGVETYKIGSILFKLTPVDEAVLTTWRSLAPEESLPAGKYFIKSEQHSKK